MTATTQFWRDPAMPYAESRRACDSRACYRPHSHPTFSIGAVDRGRSVFSHAGSRPASGSGAVALRAGMLVFVPAACVHACNPMPETTWSYQMLHLEAGWLRALRQEYAGADAVRDAREPVRIVDSSAVYAGFCRLNAILFSQAAVRDKEAALIEFIGHCDTAQGRCIDAPPCPRQHAQRIGRVLELLRDEPAADAPLAELAHVAGLSRYQLIRAFRAATGMTPHAWQLNQRVNLARERIRAGDAIAEVAYRLGFADQAHFQRVFKAHAGVTPGRFRAG